ncbi:hypothetical protein Tco_0930206 [Tanacetum coccineum]
MSAEGQWCGVKDTHVRLWNIQSVTLVRLSNPAIFIPYGFEVPVYTNTIPHTLIAPPEVMRRIEETKHERLAAEAATGIKRPQEQGVWFSDETLVIGDPCPELLHYVKSRERVAHGNNSDVVLFTTYFVFEFSDGCGPVLKRHSEDPSSAAPDSSESGSGIKRPQEQGVWFSDETLVIGDPCPELLHYVKSRERVAHGNNSDSVPNFKRTAEDPFLSAIARIQALQHQIHPKVVPVTIKRILSRISVMSANKIIHLCSFQCLITSVDLRYLSCVCVREIRKFKGLKEQMPKISEFEDEQMLFAFAPRPQTLWHLLLLNLLNLRSQHTDTC